MLLPLSRNIRLIVITVICILYYKNILITIHLITIIISAYNSPHNTYKNDSLVRSNVSKFFKTHFNLITNFKRLPSQPTIVLCNYCFDRIENIASILFPINMAVVMRDIVDERVGLSKIIKWVILTKKEGNFNTLGDDVVHHINKGRYVFVFVTKHASDAKTTYVKGVRSGIYHIAKKYNIPMTLTAIDYIDTKFGRIVPQNFRIDVSDTFVVNNVHDAMYRSMKYYQKIMKQFALKKYTSYI